MSFGMALLFILMGEPWSRPTKYRRSKRPCDCHWRMQLGASFNHRQNDISNLRPPEPLFSLEVGESLQYPPRLEVTRLSLRPDIFLLRNVLAVEDCKQLIHQAENSMSKAETVAEGAKTQARTNCLVSWLSSKDSPLVASMMTTAANLLLPRALFGETEIEDLQVLRYDQGGQYTLHHDGCPRILTVIYYLNNVAGTWFPLAKVGSDSRPVANQMELGEAMEVSRIGNERPHVFIGSDWVPGVDGLLVAGEGVSPSAHQVVVSPGDAVAFYNFNCDSTLDWRALHTGLAADRTKWIANHWFRVPSLST